MWSYLKTRKWRNSLKVGDAVKVTDFNHVFRVQTEPHDNTIMVYSVETSYLTVNLSDIHPINKKTKIISQESRKLK